MTMTHVFVPITKREKDADGNLILHGKATGPDLDLDKQICDPAWLRAAMPEWFTTGANVREMHQAKAVGKGVELEQVGDDWHLTSKIVEPGAIRLCDEEVYTGYSIGIKGARVVKDPAAPNGRIVGGSIIEVSVVDRPANPTAKLVSVKSADAGRELVLPEDVEEVDEVDKLVDPDDTPDTVDTAEDEVEGKAAEGSQEVTSAPLSASYRLPGTVTLDDAFPFLAEHGHPVEKAAGHDQAVLEAVRNGLAQCMSEELDQLCAGEDETTDLSTLLCALQMFLAWWQHEASEGEVPPPSPEGDESTTVTLGAEPDLTKAEDDTPHESPAGLDEARIGSMIDEAVTKALASQEATLQGLRDELAQVKSMAVPGGPARTRPAAAAAYTAEQETLAKQIREFEHLASNVRDADLRQGYLAKADTARDQLAKLR